MRRATDDLDGVTIDVPGWSASFYRTPKGNLRIVTANPDMWQVVIDYAEEVVSGFHRRSRMHAAYRAKTRRRNRR